MASTEQLDVLRKRNLAFTTRLKQREELMRLSGCSRNPVSGMEDRAVIQILTGDRGTARAALAKPAVRFAGTQHTQPAPFLTTEQRGGSAECSARSGFIRNSSTHKTNRQDKREAGTSCSINHSKEQREVQRQVSFEFGECESLSAPDRRRLPPLLGYDWIAGILDSEDSQLIERSDDYFNELHMFRSLNKDECIHSPQAEFSKNHSGLLLLKDKDNPEVDMETHRCTFSYRINSRLFPAPFHSQECCTVCKKHKSSHPHTMTDPALIRVSIPHSAILPQYKYKAHRRCSFDPSDSLGLPAHCLSGWANKYQSTSPPSSSLDLRSSVNANNSTGTQANDMEALSTPEVSSDQISDVSRLARYNFQHLSPKRRLKCTFHPSQ